MRTIPFQSADILLPCGCDYEMWSVVACDQYTSQPEYWQRVQTKVGNTPSALHLILPEYRLECGGVELDILSINKTMEQYLEQKQFELYQNAIFYVERTLRNGKIRRGLVGVIDLEQYDYTPGSNALIRATEGTVLSRIPPRVEVRKHAPIELPHVMLLMDDREQSVIEPLSEQTAQMTPLYGFELMEGGGHICGWALNEGQKEQISQSLAALMEQRRFETLYQAQGKGVMLFAVGDGNHSLATAKECYEQQKKVTPQEQWDTLPSRYALVELNNLHDPSLEFEPIHRVVFDVEPQELLAALCACYPESHPGQGEGHVLHYCYGETQGTITVPHPTAQLPVGTLQAFLDVYVQQHPDCRVDYIHGADVVQELAQSPNTVGFFLPPMEKENLFPTVIHDGVLPRKTFSMGEAQDKRFYLEARKIQ